MTRLRDHPQGGNENFTMELTRYPTDGQWHTPWTKTNRTGHFSGASVAVIMQWVYGNQKRSWRISHSMCGNHGDKSST